MLHPSLPHDHEIESDTLHPSLSHDYESTLSHGHESILPHGHKSTLPHDHKSTLPPAVSRYVAWHMSDHVSNVSDFNHNGGFYQIKFLKFIILQMLGATTCIPENTMWFEVYESFGKMMKLENIQWSKTLMYHQSNDGAAKPIKRKCHESKPV